MEVVRECLKDIVLTHTVQRELFPFLFQLPVCRSVHKNCNFIILQLCYFYLTHYSCIVQCNSSSKEFILEDVPAKDRSPINMNSNSVVRPSSGPPAMGSPSPPVLLRGPTPANPIASKSMISVASQPAGHQV